MQISNSFDPHTLRKILKSGFLSLIPGIVAGLQMYQTTSDLKQSLLSGVIVFLAPFVPNAVHEYKSGSNVTG